MSDRDTVPPIVITLPMVYAAVMDFRGDVLEALEKQREDHAEAISLLFRQGELHKSRIDALGAEVEDLKTGLEHEADERDQRDAEVRTKIHNLRNQVSPLFIEIEHIKDRLDALELSMRRDTELRPPPREDVDG